MIGKEAKKIEQLVSVHGFQDCILCIDNIISKCYFGLLQVHNFLFQSSMHDMSMDVNDFALCQLPMI